MSSRLTHFSTLSSLLSESILCPRHSCPELCSQVHRQFCKPSLRSQGCEAGLKASPTPGLRGKAQSVPDPSPSGFPPNLLVLPPACSGVSSSSTGMFSGSVSTLHSHPSGVKHHHRYSHSSGTLLQSQACLLSSSLPPGIQLSPMHPTPVALTLLRRGLPPKMCSSPLQPDSEEPSWKSPFPSPHILTHHPVRHLYAGLIFPTTIP